MDAIPIHAFSSDVPAGPLFHKAKRYRSEGPGNFMNTMVQNFIYFDAFKPGAFTNLYWLVCTDLNRGIFG